MSSVADAPRHPGGVTFSPIAPRGPGRVAMGAKFAHRAWRNLRCGVWGAGRCRSETLKRQRKRFQLEFETTGDAIQPRRPLWPSQKLFGTKVGWSAISRRNAPLLIRARGWLHR